MKRLNEYVMQASNVHLTQLDEYVKQALNVHPRQLDEYLSTKVKAKFEFPDEENKADIIRFLDYKDFKDLGKSPFSSQEVDEMFDKEKDKCYMVGDCEEGRIDSFWLRFSNGGKISKTNPIFFMRLNELDGYNEDYGYNVGYHTFKDYKEFKDRVINYFGWL